ncbi:hypothetical protein BDA96_03G429400 [Sorghum bicolor]|uniref:TF-B3 domain-containing protein n=2 Tax=Sorghum bicolor TaxID=4558 RepID=A0A921RI15_SORBI|nr:regulatory protein viviparous-1 isoform X2 [Sorghum bicolor]KAG0540676.1 hypothetical protein BDA96_03G429400 [Sorghum bicolor]KXG33967.1 hypothetical protein SORBI_3003G398200 [Sorghum bicolor]|eukprot:XP_021311639.1 regulatory protein viviparous-1 isoform X2 [Sorghum bicolor]
MDASGGSSPPHSQENPPEHGGDMGEAPAEEIGGEAADDFMFAEDTFPSLPDFPCLSSPSSSTFSSSSSSNSSSAYTNTTAGGAGGGGAAAAGEPSEPASAGEGFDALDDIDQILDFASLSMPWDSEPFPEVSLMLEDAMSAPPNPVCDVRREEKPVLEGTGREEACMDASSVAAGEELPRFFMEWLTSNRENISAEDLRGIRLRRSTIEAAAARLGGGRQGNMQLLKLILTWVQNHHLQKKRPRDVMEEAAGLHGQLPSPGANQGYEFPAGGQDMAAGGGTSWMPYQQQPFTPPAYGGDAVYPNAAGQQYPFHQSSSTSSVVVNSQPFSPPTVGDMHGAGGANMAWPQQYVPFPTPGASTGSYPMPQPFSAGFGGQYAAAGAAGGHPTMAPQRMAGVEASATKEARKKRMARQRRLSCLQQQRNQQLNLGQIQGSVHPQEPSPRSAHSTPVTPSAGGWGFWSPSSQQQVQNPLSIKSNSSGEPVPLSLEAVTAPPAKPAPGARLDDSPQRLAAASDKRQGAKADKNLRFLLQKVLKQSDVGSLGRIVLPKEAEVHLPELKTRDGISIPMEDIGTSRVWNMRYRFWPNNKSRMYLLENTGEFVRSNELQEGDFIVIYSDVKSGKFLIRGVKVRPPAQEQGNGSSAAGKHKLMSPAGPEKASVPGDADVDGVSGACKGRSPQGVRRDRQQGAAAMNQMAVSI